MVRFIRQRTDSGGKNFWFRKKRGRYGKCHTLHGKLCKDTVFIKGAGYPYYDDRGALLLYPGKYQLEVNENKEDKEFEVHLELETA